MVALLSCTKCQSSLFLISFHLKKTGLWTKTQILFCISPPGNIDICVVPSGPISVPYISICDVGGCLILG